MVFVRNGRESDQKGFFALKFISSEGTLNKEYCFLEPKQEGFPSKEWSALMLEGSVVGFVSRTYASGGQFCGDEWFPLPTTKWVWGNEADLAEYRKYGQVPGGERQGLLESPTSLLMEEFENPLPSDETMGIDPGDE